MTYLGRTDLYLIRPLVYTEEKLIKQYIKANNITTVASPCYVNGKTKRQYIKEMLINLHKENRDIKSNIFGAIKRSGIDDWKNT